MLQTPGSDVEHLAWRWHHHTTAAVSEGRRPQREDTAVIKKRYQAKVHASAATGATRVVRADRLGEGKDKGDGEGADDGKAGVRAW